MKSQKLLLTLITLLFIANVNFAQAPNLGTAANFVLFSSWGAVGNTGISQIGGNVGTDSGAITGFSNINGVIHNRDATTAQAVIDLESVWYHLDTLTPTLMIGPVLGSGQILYAGVDTVGAAGSLDGLLILDAQGDTNALFIIKTGGAFTTAAGATVNLINGALACNVYWVAEGAIGMATNTTMRGNLIAHNAAISIGAGCTLEGRALSTTGSVTVYGTHAFIPPNCGGPILTGPYIPSPILHTVECFALFSGNGAVTNSGETYVTGDVGTNNTSTTGYNASFVTGTLHLSPDSSTSQCALDLLTVFNYLDSIPYDIELLYPVELGHNLILTPHTYRINSAATFTDTLYLDAQNNEDAVFVIQVVGALSTGEYARVSLINGAQPKNVYWEVEGAVTINDHSFFVGTIVCHNGAIVLNTGVTLEGRALTTTGALTATNIIANKPAGGFCTALPIGLLSFTGACNNQKVVLTWSTDTETNNGYFSIERGDDGIHWQVIGTIDGAVNSSTVRNYSFIDKEPYKNLHYYRLKQTDIDGKFKYFKVIIIKNCMEELSELAIYPNPGNGVINLAYKGDIKQVTSISVYNVLREKVYQSESYQTSIDLTGKPDGIYFLQFNSASTIITKKLVIKK